MAPEELELQLLMNLLLPVIELLFTILQLSQMPKGLLSHLQVLATSSFKPIYEMQMPSNQWLNLWQKILVLSMS